MSPTIYAAFRDAAHAESAAGALIDHGIKADAISLVVSEEYHKRRGTPDDPELNYTQPTLVSGPAGSTGRFDPLNNDLHTAAGSPILLNGANNGPVGESAELDLNPAQNDYPRTGSTVPTEFSSRPPNAKYDFNPDLDKRDYNSDYVADVDRENRKEAERDMSRRNPDNLSKEADEGLEINRSDNPTSARETDRTIGAPVYDHERAAKQGLTTTTIGDAADAAKKGVVAGLGVGAIAGLAALLVPGFGLVIGGGALATALAGLAASAGAGGVAGGVVGYLKDQGVPPADIPRYQQAYDAGGAILQIHVEEGDDRAKVEQILSKYGAVSVDKYGYAA